ncbi:hypothetical protein Bpfe_005275 [Biomphalaria pfeifferi]|uniref:Uncharacterized protein n=1 Tax=Biomphalaria pfeifferi TaxID=112525 RepID=A0AAD8C2G8_BIOPF|nr:hypothetical protein Bpfe_005275 [Biomphalaria pfeifferi]
MVPLSLPPVDQAVFETMTWSFDTQRDSVKTCFPQHSRCSGTLFLQTLLKSALKGDCKFTCSHAGNEVQCAEVILCYVSRPGDKSFRVHFEDVFLLTAQI